MDFRSIDVGTFVYHCHLLSHEDNGMMAKVQFSLTLTKSAQLTITVVLN